MIGSSKVIANTILLGNLSKLGPSYLADSVSDFFSNDQQMLFSSRVVVLTGMGHQTTPEGKIQGPVPVAEPSNYSGTYEFIFYQMRPGLEKYGNLHLVLVIIYEVDDSELVRKNLKDFDKYLQSFEFDLTGFEDGLFDPSRKDYLADRVTEIHNNLERILANSPPENSIFDISYVTSLEGRRQELAKKLMSTPTGIRLSELESYDDAVQFFLKQRMVVIDGEGEDKVIRGR